jgi:hypothetical protein
VGKPGVPDLPGNQWRQTVDMTRADDDDAGVAGIEEWRA